MNAAIYFGEVMHHRFRPFSHRFVYRVFTFLLDIDRLDQIAEESRLFRYNRAGLFSFHDRDHGPRDGSPLRPWVEKSLRAAGLEAAGATIKLLCLPRLFGYVFNPLSIYFCHDDKDRLRAILYQVKNTFGEQHCYLLPVDADHPADQSVSQSVAKHFYVSPFIDMGATYRFRIRPPGERLSIVIAENVAEGRQLVATQTGRRAPFTDANLGRALLLFPFITVQIMAAIHWQALLLWLKGARYHSRPAMPDNDVTIQGSSQ